MPHIDSRSDPNQAAANLLAYARSECAPFRLLSTLPFTKNAQWRDSVTTISPKRRRFAWLWGSTGITDPLLIPRLLLRARGADAVLLNGGERTDLVYLALAGITPGVRAPHLIVDAHWQAHAGAAGRFQRWLLRLGLPVLAEAQPHSPEEIPLYRQHFGIPEAKIRPLPWSTSLNGYDIQACPTRVDEIVSGGFSYRDYPTLFEAVRQCRLPLRVGLPPSRATDAARRQAGDCEQIRIVSDWSMQAYWQAVADARVFVMALTPGLTRCSADQTILNAMSFGTVVVATDSIASRLYIRHGENGFLVPEADPRALAETLKRVFELPEPEYQRISTRAAADVQAHYREDTRLAHTLLRAVDAAKRFRAAAVRTGQRVSDGLARAFGCVAFLL